MPIPTRNDLDEEILGKLVDVIAREWECPTSVLFKDVVMAYAAVRQLALLKSIHEQLGLVEPALRRLDETLLCMLSDMPQPEDEDDEPFNIPG